MKKVGYTRRDPISHRPYSRKASLARYAKNKKFTYVGTKIGGKVVYGLGHKAGESWGDSKDIDPSSQTHKYSKNSPSFDEGVYKSKMKRKKEVEEKMKSMADKM